MKPQSGAQKLTGDVDMIDISLIPGDVLDQESTWLFDLFDKIKLLAAPRQAREDK
jgi:hypothetical protein